MRRIIVAALLTYCILSTLYIYSVEEEMMCNAQSLKITDQMTGHIYTRLTDLEIMVDKNVLPKVSGSTQK